MTVLSIILVVIILLVLFTLSLKLKIFDLKGSVAALILGAWVAFMGSILWLILMVFFALSSYMATRAFFTKKKEMNLQEGRSGERRTTNIVFAGVIGAVIAFVFFLSSRIDPGEFPYFELFAISFASINADTFASEIGSVDSKVYLITTFRKTRQGINGGVSITGIAASILGGFLVGLVFVLLDFGYFSVIPALFITAMGVFGSTIDSILGALYENAGKINKGTVNFLATLASVILSVVLIYLLPSLS